MAGQSEIETSPEIFEYFAGKDSKPSYFKFNNIVVCREGDLEKARAEINGMSLESLNFGHTKV